MKYGGLLLATTMLFSGCAAEGSTGTDDTSSKIGGLIDPAPADANFAKPAPFEYKATSLSIEDTLKFEMPKAKEQYRIALMLTSLQGEYFVSVAYGAEQAAKAAGVELDLIAAQGFASPEVQLEQLGDLLQKDYDAIMLMPADVDGTVPLVDMAQNAGLVLTVNGSMLNSNKMAQAVQSDYAAGQMSADIVAEHLEGKGGPGLIMGGPQQATWASARVAGFQDRVKEKYPDIEIVSVAHQNFVDPTEGLNTFTDVTQRHPKLDWIYAVDYNILEAPSMPVEYQENSVYVAMGLYGTSQKALRDGQVNAIIGLMPGFGAHVGLARAVQQLNGDDVPAITMYPSPVYTKDNLDVPETRFEIYPDGFKPSGYKP